MNDRDTDLSRIRNNVCGSTFPVGWSAVPHGHEEVGLVDNAPARTEERFISAIGSIKPLNLRSGQEQPILGEPSALKIPLVALHWDNCPKGNAALQGALGKNLIGALREGGDREGHVANPVKLVTDGVTHPRPPQPFSTLMAADCHLHQSCPLATRR